MNRFSIKKLTVSSLYELQLLSRRTFYETFWMENKHADMMDYLENELSAEKLLMEFKNTGSEFYFVMHFDKPVAYLKINYGEAQTEPMGPKAIEIERIYVLYDYQGFHLGRLLFNKVIDIAKVRNADTIWLGVWELNHKAIYFYKKYGFIEFGKHNFKLGSDLQTDILMKLQL